MSTQPTNNEALAPADIEGGRAIIIPWAAQSIRASLATAYPQIAEIISSRQVVAPVIETPPVVDVAEAAAEMQAALTDQEQMLQDARDLLKDIAA